MLTWQGERLLLAVYVQPNAKDNKVVGIFEEQIKIQITAPANDNKANQQLKKWLAKQFKVGITAITIEKGQHHRKKTVAIQSPKVLPDWLKSYI